MTPSSSYSMKDVEDGVCLGMSRIGLPFYVKREELVPRVTFYIQNQTDLRCFIHISLQADRTGEVHASMYGRYFPHNDVVFEIDLDPSYIATDMSILLDPGLLRLFSMVSLREWPS